MDPQKKTKLAFVERRQHTRADIELNAKILLPDTEKYTPVTIHNISEGGAFVATKKKLHPGEKIEIKIELAPGLVNIKAEARVVYTTSKTLQKELTIATVEEMESFVRRGHLKGCGICFTKISEKDQKFLHNFVTAIS